MIFGDNVSLTSHSFGPMYIPSVKGRDPLRCIHFISFLGRSLGGVSGSPAYFSFIVINDLTVHAADPSENV